MSTPEPDPIPDQPDPAEIESAEIEPAETDALPPGAVEVVERARVAAVADPARVRRAPRFGRFAFAGVVLGAIIAFALAAFGTENPVLDTGGLFLLLWIFLGSLGALVFCGLAVWLDRRSARRADAASPSAPIPAKPNGQA